MNFIKSRVIYADLLDELEEKVKSEDSLWVIFDEELAKKVGKEILI